MARSIDYRSTFAYPAEKVFATMTDPEYLRERLRELGGPGSALLEHEATPEHARYRLRQGLAEQDLPPIVGKVVGGDLVIERIETLRRILPGSYAGDVDVRITAAPASAAGTMTLTDADEGSEFAVNSEVTVRVPLLGSTIEGIVAEQVTRLQVAETEFTTRWLASH